MDDLSDARANLRIAPCDSQCHDPRDPLEDADLVRPYPPVHVVPRLWCNAREQYGVLVIPRA